MNLVEALRITYEAMGQPVTDLALAAFACDLSGYPEPDVLAALSRCRRELRRLTLMDILDRLPHGHPGAEEAWAIVAGSLKSESVTIVWTDEMAEAYGVARGLRDDLIAARKAFQEAYTAAVGRARLDGAKPIWRPSLGFDKTGRSAPILEAVRKGRMLPEFARRVCPELPAPDGDREILQLLGPSWPKGMPK